MHSDESASADNFRVMARLLAAHGITPPGEEVERLSAGLPAAVELMRPLYALAVRAEDEPALHFDPRW